MGEARTKAKPLGCLHSMLLSPELNIKKNPCAYISFSPLVHFPMPLTETGFDGQWSIKEEGGEEKLWDWGAGLGGIGPRFQGAGTEEGWGENGGE